MSGRGLLRRWIDGVRGVFSAAPECDVQHAGGPFLHWVPDHDGHRLAGDFLPPSQRRAPGPTTRSRRRSRRV